MLEIKNNILLAPYTTFKVGGLAKNLVEVTTVDELKEALDEAKKNSWPIFVLAGGSNVIFSSKEFDGLVTVIHIMGVSIDGQKATVGAAVMMNDLVTQLNQAGLAGMEWAGGLPGTFGGAVRGNAGCFGGEMKDSILSVESVNKNTGEITKRNNKECEFIYRGSYFKSHQDEIIVSAELELTTASPVDLEKISDDHRMFRKARHPQKPSAGSVFKNTPVEKVPAQFMADFKNFVKTDPFPIVPTGKIIADTGLVGASVGDAQVSSQHANMIINNNHATGEDIFELIQKIKLAVREKYGIELEVEPELVGF